MLFSSSPDTFIGLEQSSYTVGEDDSVLQICVYGTVSEGTAVLDMTGASATINGE